MNRRAFIKGAMAAVAASYVGGTFNLDNLKLEWIEKRIPNYKNRWGLGVKLLKNGKMYGNFITYNGKPDNATRAAGKKILLKWLEENL